MKKTLIALFALTGVAMAANIDVYDSITLNGTEHASDRLDFRFDGCTGPVDRTINVTTTGNATIAASDGYGLENGTSRTAANYLNLNITGTLAVTGLFKAIGTSASPNGHISITTTLSQDEADSLALTGKVSRNVITMGSISSLTTAGVMSLTVSNAPETLTIGGLVAKVGDDFYAASDVTFGSSWSINSGAQTMKLATNTLYTYVELSSSGTSPKAIGFIAVPEPATATLSLLALAALAARRRRH